MEYGILFLIALLVCILWIMHRRKRSAVKAERAAMFNDCTDLFEKYRITQDDIYYPVFEGRYRGHDFRLEPIADHIAFRTIPSLWLLVTLRKRTPYEGIFDFLVRQRNEDEYCYNDDGPGGTVHGGRVRNHGDDAGFFGARA